MLPIIEISPVCKFPFESNLKRKISLSPKLVLCSNPPCVYPETKILFSESIDIASATSKEFVPNWRDQIFYHLD